MQSNVHIPAMECLRRGDASDDSENAQVIEESETDTSGLWIWRKLEHSEARFVYNPPESDSEYAAAGYAFKAREVENTPQGCNVGPLQLYFAAHVGANESNFPARHTTIALSQQEFCRVMSLRSEGSDSYGWLERIGDDGYRILRRFLRPWSIGG